MSTLTTTITITIPLPLPLSSKSTTTIISCGPRDNRSPISRGRTLSSEAILAVQSLKRSNSLNPQTQMHQNHHHHLSRLLKPDLISAFSELLRQDLPLLALSHLLPLLLSDPTLSPQSASSLSLFADLLKSLAKTNHHSHLLETKNHLIQRLDSLGGIRGEDLRGPARLVKSLMGAGCGDGVMEVYKLMKKGGCVPNDYLFKYMIRGLRRLGEEDGAREVERDYEGWVYGGGWGVAVDEEEEEEEEEVAATV